MKNYKSKQLIEEIYDECASANECTGLFQRVALSPEEVAKFHELYNEQE